MLIKLFLGFLKVGCFAFGGAYSAIPLIRGVVLDNAWLTDEMLSNMIAVSESTPGPIMVNLATYIGAQKAGVFGSAVATFAVVLPSFIITIIVTLCMEKFLKNKYIKATMRGLIASVVGIIFATGLYMVFENCIPNQSFDLRAALLTIFLAILFFGSKKVFKKKITPIMLICISAVLGVIVFAI